MKLRSIFTVLTALLIILSCDKDKIDLPDLTTSAITNITASSAVSGGNIKTDGGSDIISRGVCWSENEFPVITDNHSSDGNGKGIFISNISGLKANTQYYLRAYATNISGTAYGETLNFKTLPGNNESVSDIDGNKYQALSIAGNVWMVENLRVSRYSNGDPVPNINGDDWDNQRSGAYCYYNNDPAFKAKYGYLYNWFAAVDNRNICPQGWHIATKYDWEKLAESGLELKEAGNENWAAPNNCFPNNSGFKALPGGNCGYDGNFNGIGESGYWWTADEESSENAWICIMTNQNMGLSGWVNADKWVGGSIRCVKD